MGEVDVLRAQIVRPNVNQAWGFRLEGGADTGQPLKILRVTPASPAHKIGLRNGDEVTEIGDIPTSSLTYQQALDIIQDAGDTLLLTLERKAVGAVPTNPVLSKHIPEGQEAAKFYQPLKMSGGGTGRKFHIVQSKPFHAVEKPRSIPQYQPQPQSPQYPQYQQYQPAQPTVNYQPEPAATYQPQPQTVSYSAQPTYQAAGPKPYQPYQQEYQEPEEDPYNPSGHQSRTFRALQSMMENENKTAGHRVGASSHRGTLTNIAEHSSANSNSENKTPVSNSTQSTSAAWPLKSPHSSESAQLVGQPRNSLSSTSSSVDNTDSLSDIPEKKHESGKVSRGESASGLVERKSANTESDSGVCSDDSHVNRWKNGSLPARANTRTDLFTPVSATTIKRLLSRSLSSSALQLPSHKTRSFGLSFHKDLWIPGNFKGSDRADTVPVSCPWARPGKETKGSDTFVNRVRKRWEEGGAVTAEEHPWNQRRNSVTNGSVSTRNRPAEFHDRQPSVTNSRKAKDRKDFINRLEAILTKEKPGSSAPAIYTVPVNQALPRPAVNSAGESSTQQGQVLVTQTSDTGQKMYKTTLSIKSLQVGGASCSGGQGEPPVTDGIHNSETSLRTVEPTLKSESSLINEDKGQCFVESEKEPAIQEKNKDDTFVFHAPVTSKVKPYNNEPEDQGSPFSCPPRREVNHSQPNNKTGPKMIILQREPNHTRPQAPYAGSQGLPQQRTVSMDKIRQEEQARRSGSPRVKVFMPQQYNTPMGLYSAQNVMDTFSTQASELLDELGRQREARGQADF